jgi:hypothetical protein
MGRSRWPVSAPGNGNGLGASGLPLPCEGFDKALYAEVVVPLFGDALVLLIEAGQKEIVVAVDGARELLDPDVVVAVVLCEAPDYVE